MTKTQAGTYRIRHEHCYKHTQTWTQKMQIEILVLPFFEGVKERWRGMKKGQLCGIACKQVLAIFSIGKRVKGTLLSQQTTAPLMKAPRKVRFAKGPINLNMPHPTTTVSHSKLSAMKFICEMLREKVDRWDLASESTRESNHFCLGQLFQFICKVQTIGATTDASRSVDISCFLSND
ncbi:hypothetical protein LOAG_01574 [Loa loa]|uniref:Uncharacterized protein n=1 Tax=Loa loa TaxID=7209 RepID=A0A1S0UAN3_LOALO|nr:hypothetical protein LOAG_01574 [Loa loa]EFO26899.1 hypothetical protein LOAG_01574 [Loa loa]